MPRPVVGMALEGLLAAPMECLLDTGALRTRMSAELAPLAGIELDDAPAEEFFAAGLKTAGALARVNLTVTDGTEEFSWDAPVWFCDRGRILSAWPGPLSSPASSTRPDSPSNQKHPPISRPRHFKLCN